MAIVLSRIRSCFCPTGRYWIQPTDAFPKQAQDVDLHLAEAFEQVVNLTLHCHTDAGHACRLVKRPTQGRPLRGLMHVVG